MGESALHFVMYVVTYVPFTTGNILTVSDLLILSTQDISRRSRITHSEAQEIVSSVFNELKSPPLFHLDDPDVPKDEIITTGDSILDQALGGGVRTRKLWEVTGERYVQCYVETEGTYRASHVVQQERHSWQCNLRYAYSSRIVSEGPRAPRVFSRLPGHFLPIALLT